MNKFIVVFFLYFISVKVSKALESSSTEDMEQYLVTENVPDNEENVPDNKENVPDNEENVSEYVSDNEENVLENVSDNKENVLENVLENVSDNKENVSENGRYAKYWHREYLSTFISTGKIALAAVACLVAITGVSYFKGQLSMDPTVILPEIHISHTIYGSFYDEQLDQNQFQKCSVFDNNLYMGQRSDHIEITRVIPFGETVYDLAKSCIESMISKPNNTENLKSIYKCSVEPASSTRVSEIFCNMYKP